MEKQAGLGTPRQRPGRPAGRPYTPITKTTSKVAGTLVERVQGRAGLSAVSEEAIGGPMGWMYQVYLSLTPQKG
jgi:hypothetical protein